MVGEEQERRRQGGGTEKKERGRGGKSEVEEVIRGEGGWSMDRESLEERGKRGRRGGGEDLGTVGHYYEWLAL